MQTPLLWNIAANGAIVQLLCEGQLAANDRGVLLGDGVFDTLRVVDQQAQHCDAHLARFINAAAVLQLPCVVTAAHIAAAAQQLQQGTLRITITRGAAPRGLLPPPQAKMQTWLLGYNSLPARGVIIEHAAVSTICRNHTSPLSGIKSLGQMDQVLALQQAQQVNASEALMPNTRGMLSCASAANIMYTLHGHDAIFTPPLHDGVLPGITRARLLSLLTEYSLPANNLGAVSGMAITNSLRGACGIANIVGVGALPASAQLAERLNKIL